MEGVAGAPVRYSGHDGIREYFTDMAESWQSLAWDLDEIKVLDDDRVFVVSTQRLRGRASGIDVSIELGMTFTLRDGLVVEMRTAYDPDEIRRLAGE